LDDISQKVVTTMSVDDDDVGDAGSFQRMDDIGDNSRKRMDPEGYTTGKFRMFKGSGIGEKGNTVRGLKSF
jgi:hypothetical protein